MNIEDEISRIVSGFNQLPYLFIGTGLSMRYSNAPSWNELLLQIWNSIYEEDEFYFKKLVRKVENELSQNINRPDYLKKYFTNPKIGEILQKDFNEKYFENDLLANRLFSDEENQKIINNNFDPFKYFVCKKMMSFKVDFSKNESNEIQYLTKYQNKFAGIITTNYDNLIEEIFTQYEAKIGQKGILTSNSINAFEIYKIHGCVSSPNSIVITQTDYENFQDRLKYLSAKLLTIFVEHPIIFIGYGLHDYNIMSLLRAFSDCLDEEQIKRTQDNFIFISPAWQEKEHIQIKDIDLGKSRISMTEVVLSDYSLLYKQMNKIEAGLQIKVIRQMQNMICDIIKSTKATKNLIVSDLNSPSIDDSKMAIYIGNVNSITTIGFNMFNIMDIIEDVLFDNKPYLIDKQLIEKTFKNIRSVAGSTFIPIYKYIKKLNYPFEKIPSNYLIIKDLNDIKPNTSEIRLIGHKEPLDTTEKIVKCYPFHIPKQIALIKLSAKSIKADDLGNYLRNLYENNSPLHSSWLSGFKKLTALYDYKMYKD